MELFSIGAFGILGIIVGSFLNVVILRMNTGKGVGGRSQCLSCNHQLSWYELIPLISFMVQGGRCRHCRTSLSWQYPLVEIITGLLFAGAASVFLFGAKPLTLLLWLILVSAGMVIAVYDIRHYVIPNRPLKILFIVSLILGMQGWGLVLVPLPFLFLWVISQGRWIGFGDVELMACAGVLLGVSGGFSAVMLAFWTAALVILPWVLIQVIQKKKFSHSIPFGPFLLWGMVLVGIFHLDIFKLLAYMLH